MTPRLGRGPGELLPRKARSVAAVVAAVALAAPRVAAACATCISSGDRGYSWPYIGLILTPFVVAVSIVTVLAWHAGWRWHDVIERLSAWTARLRHRPEAAALSPRTNTETT
jgi:hypothetical protein